MLFKNLLLPFLLSAVCHRRPRRSAPRPWRRHEATAPYFSVIPFGLTDRQPLSCASHRWRLTQRETDAHDSFVELSTVCYSPLVTGRRRSASFLIRVGISPVTSAQSQFGCSSRCPHWHTSSRPRSSQFPALTLTSGAARERGAAGALRPRRPHFSVTRGSHERPRC